MSFSNVFGAPPAELADIAAGARQFSPLSPGAASLEALAPCELDNLALLAPPAAIERRHVLALALRALAPGAPFLALAPKDKGGGRLVKELADLGCPAHETAKRHHRICRAEAQSEAAAVEAAIQTGAPLFLDSLGLWTQPGVFAWDRIDPGSALLIRNLPEFSGRGADFGCGLGILAHKILRSPAVTALALIDIDRRAIELCRRNVDDPRVALHWADARAFDGFGQLDFVAMNPPFHEAGAENRGLGLGFIEKAAKALRKGGQCWVVANRHLPYEAVLARNFSSVRTVDEAEGYKIMEARK